MKLLVIFLFLAVPLVLITGNLVRKLLNRSADSHRNGILRTGVSLLVLAAAVFEDQIFDWLLTLFGGRLIPYLGILLGYVAALALIHEILSIVLLQGKLKLLHILALVPLIAFGVYCIVNAQFLGQVFDIYLSQ